MTTVERQLAAVGSVDSLPTDLITTTPPADLHRLWAAMTTLRSTERPATHSIVSPELAMARDILGEAVHRTGPSGARRVPSAGAIFPYETLALCPASADGESWGLFRVEGATGTCTMVPISLVWLRRLVSAMPGDRAGCYLIVMARPWLSIRKYGPRGYLYTQLDAAHAAVNIVGVALGTGAAVLRAGLPVAAGIALRNGFPPFHEPHSVIQLDKARDYPGDPTVAVREEAPARRTPEAYDFEARAWDSIVAPLHATPETAASVEPADTTVLELPDARPDRALRAEWRALSAARRSAKRFAAEPLSGGRLAATIGALATPLPITFGQLAANGCPNGQPTVSATVLVSDRLVLSPAEQAAISRCARLVRYPATPDSMAADVRSLIAACMGQAHVGHGQAFVLLHAPAGLVPAEATGNQIRQALFRAGAGAQLLCLAATRNDVAASPIGGFDSAVWTRIAQLPGDTQLLYLLVLGTPVAEAGPGRNDRAEKATAHGES
ncbi:MAG: nitroreductase family protein [Jatrophihabitantaceae bacterium]